MDYKGKVIDALTLATREADQEQHKVGGSFHQWVSDFFLPALLRQGYQVVPTGKVTVVLGGAGHNTILATPCTGCGRQALLKQRDEHWECPHCLRPYHLRAEVDS